MDERKSSVKYEVMDESMQWVSPPEGSVIVPVLEESDVSPVAGKPGFRKMYLAAGAALLSAVSMGMAITYSSPATADMKSKHLVNDEQISWIGSLLALGALFGGVSAGYLTDKLGRKETIFFIYVPFVAGWICIIAAESIEVIYVGRLLTGFCCGMVPVAAPVYLVEISTPEVRGFVGGLFQVSSVTGMLLLVSLGAVLDWKWLALACLIIAAFGFFVLYSMPESPRWLLAHGRRQDAIDVIKYLHGNSVNAENECKVIEEDLRLQPKGRLTMAELKQPTIYKPALLSMGLFGFQQASGMSPIIMYTVSIFQSAQSSLSANMATIVVCVMQVICTVVCSFINDRIGRRALLMVSGLGMAISLGVMGVYEMMLKKHNSSEAHYGWVPLVSLMIFVAAFSFGYGPISLLMIPELLPTRARGAMGGVAGMFAGTLAFIFTKNFPAMEKSLHLYGTYWFFAAVDVLSFFFAAFLLPETKGKPLEEVQLFFQDKKKINY